ncbi:hypothetical protein [Bacillus suaedae]|uniref:Uncharacterized protein n=1 Tax=Halalkalibacter suaedae TaxID=2822140 RepID=A0A940WWH8_9BACI|nr:hypothetical protein [Bacillus suaedae]MBP3951787.1 hypothetical protein [Bacillus suaedae]
MKKLFIMTIFYSVLIVSACGNEKASVSDFELIPTEKNILSIHVGGVDENQASTDETNILIDEEEKISQMLVLLGDVEVEPINKQYVTDQQLHQMIDYNIFFIEDYDSEKHLQLWLLSDGTIVFPTWGEQYYKVSNAQDLQQKY